QRTSWSRLAGRGPDIQYRLAVHPPPDQCLGRLGHLLPWAAPADLNSEPTRRHKLHEGGQLAASSALVEKRGQRLGRSDRRVRRENGRVATGPPDAFLNTAPRPQVPPPAHPPAPPPVPDPPHPPARPPPTAPPPPRPR